ncbi:Clavaminate synthase-like protein [Pseudovirgaria hyperparasitica]|uniref:Clavaminate synthase-like protein n=1 Tax=Pseudovirgaria hyperparasitica TaxID=470096 RepID=A0A6A6W5G0_9PEZI|nr:Clavaminate synthase-like protein [Pseudovirgaria hyperparasitica]KAF2758112.1 Clavaminate synthase-like protein [Pseudovirgaria hyperparasitica]
MCDQVAKTPKHHVVDYRTIAKDAPPEVRKEALKAVDDALRSHGFFYLSHHSVPPPLLAAAFDWMKKFFALPHEVKSLARRSKDPFDPRGYTIVGDAVLDQEHQPHTLGELAEARAKAPVEQRETLELGCPHATNQSPNKLLPEEIFPGFAGWLDEWWDTTMRLQLSLMECFDEILLGENASSGEGLVSQQDLDQSYSNMSLIHYHNMAISDIKNGTASRCNAHTDSSQLTLLFQDDVGGLEVLDQSTPNGQAKFVPVPPVPGMMIVQLGDMLEKQSNGRWRSALHRVTAPSSKRDSVHATTPSAGTEGTLQDRYSVAVFVYPQFDTVIKPLPGCSDKGPWNSFDWGSVQTAGEWWRKRIELEFGKYASS